MKKIISEVNVLIPDGAKRVFEGMIFDTYQWPQKLFDGSTHSFEMLKRPDTVTVITVVDEQILTIKDEQPNRTPRLSFPGGRIDAEDASTLAAAKRETKEETGYEFDNFRLVNVVQPEAKIEWFIYFYIAWNGRKVAEPHLDAGEKITIIMRSFDETKSLVVDKAGYMGETKEIFDKVNSIEELTALPEFKGKEIDR